MSDTSSECFILDGEVDIDFGWIPTNSVPSEVVAAANADFMRDGPEEFRDAPLSTFGWQEILGAPGWWLIRIVSRSRFWGYGLYYLWTPGTLRYVAGNGWELMALVEEGRVALKSPEAAKQWFRLCGVLKLKGGVAEYTLPELARCAVHREDGGWRIECARRKDSKLEQMSITFDDGGKPVNERVISETAGTAPPSPMFMSAPDLTGVVMSLMNKEFSIATPDERAELANTNWTWLRWRARIYALLMGLPIVVAIVCWRMVRVVRVVPLLPGLLISRYVPSTLDISAARLHAVLAYLESSWRLRITSIVVWFVILSTAASLGGKGAALGAAIFLTVGYGHATWVFVRNEAVRLRIFRNSERATEYLSHLNDFALEYALSGAFFLLVLPLLVGRLSSIFASSVPGLPTTFGEAYQFTLASLLAQVPDSIRAFLPFLPDPGEPGTPYAAYLRSGIQRIFQVSALGLLFDKLWAARGLRKEADERLHRSLREAVALGDRVCGHLLRTLRKEVDTSKLRMAVLALGVIGDARHATKLGILRASGYCSEIAAETGVALALLGDLAPLPPQAAVVLAPSQHGGDTPLDLCRLVDALRSDQPTAEAAEDLRRLLVWQGVSTSLRHAVMFSLLRIPGALSARDAMEWTKEFVGSSRMSERGQEVLHMLGQASLSVSMEELATELASHWIRNPLVSLIPLARYTSASLDHDAHAYGRSGYPVALFVALTRAFEKEKARRHHRWRAVDKVLHAFSRWKCMINCFVFATVLEAFTKRRDQLLKERTRVFDGQVAASRNGSAYNGEPGQALT